MLLMSNAAGMVRATQKEGGVHVKKDGLDLDARTCPVQTATVYFIRSTLLMHVMVAVLVMWRPASVPAVSHTMVTHVRSLNALMTVLVLVVVMQKQASVHAQKGGTAQRANFKLVQKTVTARVEAVVTV
jgi:hypothetical protein